MQCPCSAHPLAHPLPHPLALGLWGFGALGLWGLRVLFVVVDSCNANVGIHNSVATHLSNMLQGEGIQDHPVYAIHCLCHILHNTAKHAFESAGQSQLYQRTGYNTALFWVLDHISAELRKDLPEGMPLVEEAVGTRWLSYARIAIYCCQHHAEIVHVLDVRIAATPASAKGTPSHTNLLELQRLLTLSPDVMAAADIFASGIHAMTRRSHSFTACAPRLRRDRSRRTQHVRCSPLPNNFT
ncbi:hypothetical protein V8C86DRAFT_2947399 [Haematococcus lacustris]